MGGCRVRSVLFWRVLCLLLFLLFSD